MTIRVVRILEYTYPTPQDRDKDMSLWTHDGPRIRGVMRTLGIHETETAEIIDAAVRPAGQRP